MEKHRAIPPGCMSVGEIAKKMGVTVRTLQHYHREGLLPPSASSEGGRRLYTDGDVIRLHQILSLKRLGFSLGDIKNRLISLDDPSEVAEILAEQAAAVREKIRELSDALARIEALRAEALEMQAVDFKKYADILVNLEMKNDFYWLIKHFDSETLDHIRLRFDRESGQAFLEKFLAMQNEAIRLGADGVPPAGREGQDFAKAYWALIQEFTNGDAAMLLRLVEVGKSGALDQEWQQKLCEASAFIEPALGAYFSNLGTDPFQEAAI